MSHRLEPALVELLEEIVARRIKEELKERTQLVTIDQFTEAIERIDRRFEAMDKRFEALDKHLGDLIEAMNKRFEALDKHLGDLIEAMNKRFEAVDKRFEALDKRLGDLIEAMNKRFEVLNLSLSRIESKEGILFHKTVLELMKDTLKLENIDPAKIRKEILTDSTGEFFFQGYITDIDVLVENSNTYLIDVKSTAGPSDIAHFIQTVKLYEKISGKKPTQLVLIALRINETGYSFAAAQKIHILAGEIL